MDGNTLNFTDEAIEVIAESALEMKTGARGLRGIIEQVLNEIMFDTSGEHDMDITISKDYVEKILKKKKRLS